MIGEPLESFHNLIPQANKPIFRYACDPKQLEHLLRREDRRQFEIVVQYLIQGGFAPYLHGEVIDYRLIKDEIRYKKIEIAAVVYDHNKSISFNHQLRELEKSNSGQTKICIGNDEFELVHLNSLNENRGKFCKELSFKLVQGLWDKALYPPNSPIEVGFYCHDSIPREWR